MRIDRRRVGAFCRRRKIERLSLFGSVLREDFRTDSDVDTLVEFEPGYGVGLITFSGMENEERIETLFINLFLLFLRF